jgi:diketogulonate reductase-like aldo/keto reductase
MASIGGKAARLPSISRSSSTFIYGTAWKKENTTRLVKEALAAGFRGIDTAAQPRHYREDLVGMALRESYKEGLVRREDIYVSMRHPA